MELKDIVLSTLAEIDDNVAQDDKIVLKKVEKNRTKSPENKAILNSKEEQFLNNLRERILVLFEGLKSPNTQNIEAKLDLTLNFLEYLLATIDERVNEIKK